MEQIAPRETSDLKRARACGRTRGLSRRGPGRAEHAEYDREDQRGARESGTRPGQMAATPSTSIRKSGWNRLLTTIRVAAGSSPPKISARAWAMAGKSSIRVM